MTARDIRLKASRVAVRLAELAQKAFETGRPEDAERLIRVAYFALDHGFAPEPDEPVAARIPN